VQSTGEQSEPHRHGKRVSVSPYPAYDEPTRTADKDQSRDTETHPRIEEQIVGMARESLWPSQRLDVSWCVLVQILIESYPRQRSIGEHVCRTAPNRKPEPFAPGREIGTETLGEQEKAREDRDARERSHNEPEAPVP